jgi:lipoyl(octanoyl) transferase
MPVLPLVRNLGICEYEQVWKKMVLFTRERGPETRDEIWVLQHYPVYTQGTSSHDIPASPGRSIPLIHSDRGGQITYHGPGQLVAYLLMDIKRRKTGPKSFVHQVEKIIIDFLKQYGVTAHRKTGAPGVYVADEKIAALGLRISRGCCYHGLSINIDMDLSPYDWINPCGYEELTVTQLSRHTQNISFEEVKALFNKYIISL